MISIRTVNLVVTTDLKHNLNLNKIAHTLPNTEYNPEQFPGLIMRIKEPKTAVLLFSSGRLVCTGAKATIYAKKSVYKVIDYLKKVNIKIAAKPILKIQNLVGAGELGFNLNLSTLAMKLNNVEYEPEQFPGLVYKIKTQFNASFLLFSNGKIVCTGTKSKEQMNKCLKQMIKNLNKIKKLSTKRPK